MKIVQFKIGSYGGAERFFFKLIEALKERGIEQHIIHNDHPTMCENAARTGVPATVIPFPKKRVALSSRLALRRTVKLQKPDVLFCWANRAGRRAFRGDFVTVGRLGGYMRARHFLGCQHLICNTPGLVDHIVSQGWPRRYVSMISNFGELEPRPAVDRSTIGVRDDQFMALSLGRFDPWKGFQDMISALKHLPEDVVYVIAGKGEKECEWQQLAVDEGVGDRVRFIGWRDDQAALLAAADVCVVPSHLEPLSNVTLEAWSLGVPVVAARSEGPAWLIDDETTGMLVPIGSPEALADRVRALHDDPDLRRAIGEGGRLKWQGGFSKDEICRQYIELFEELIRARHARRFWSFGIKRSPKPKVSAHA